MLIIEKGKLVGKRLWKSRVVKTVILGLLIFFSLDFFFPVSSTVPYSTIITARDGSILHAFLSRDDKWRMYAELNEITPTLRDAILFKEDKYFRYHPGFNPVAMLRAAARNLLTGRRTSGASTITMQTVRLLEPRDRTYGSKLIELFRALQLEVHYSKDEILQLYLNLIPYGSNIEGLKSASLIYFGKPPVLLSLAELTTLTIIPNRPSSLRLGTRNVLVVQERNRWLARFRTAKLFNDETIEDALNEPLMAYRRKAPQKAPHLSRRLRIENPTTPIVHSTLNSATQATAEQVVQRYADRIRAYNIHNSAVLIVDNLSHEVVAYVGSANFGNTFDGGQVDGVRSVRSPGSALKPLLYGLAFDAGIITPKTKLADVPINFGGYEPDNYDRRFNGPVTAEFALANSLNIPAVALLKEIGTPALVSTLQKAGFSAIKKQAKELGLSMILGGCGVTLEEMTRLYAGLANGGVLEELQFTSLPSPLPLPSPPTPLPKRERGAGRPVSLPSPVLGEGSGRSDGSVRVLSPEAAYLVTHTLTQITRPDLPNNFDNSYHLPRIAWKTGTSYGRRDAWSIGYNQRYTIGVWVGNFSGIGVPELSGANTATPLLFQLFNVLDYNSPTGWFKAPKEASKLAMRLICPETGDIAGEFCTNPVTDYFIMGVSRHRHCQHRKAVFTNAAGTISYCTQCRPDSGSVRKSYPNLSPELIAFYKSRHIPFEAVPPHNPACERVFGNAEQGGPQITSLTNGSEYFINPKQPAGMELSCQAANDVQTVFWYLNDKLYSKAKPTKGIFFKPKPGALKISCADDKGRSSDIRILVQHE